MTKVSAVFVVLLFAAPVRANKPEVYQLENGLSVVLQPDRSAPIVAVDLMLRVSAAEEMGNTIGIAHLLEHMMFQGSLHIARLQQTAMLDAMGAVEGAVTHYDYTHYRVSARSAQLEKLLWLYSDRLGFLSQALADDRLASEKSVVDTERTRGLSSPITLASVRLFELLFSKEHPYYYGRIGGVSEVNAISLDQVRRFYKTHYCPSRASLALVGDFDPAAARSLVKRYFGSLPPCSAERPTQKVRYPTPKLPINEQMSGGTMKLAIAAWHLPPAYSAGARDAEILATILASGRSGVLHDALVVKQKAATWVECSVLTAMLSSVFLCQAILSPSGSAGALDEALHDVLTGYSKDAIEPSLLLRAKQRVKLRLVQSMARSVERAERLNNRLIATGKVMSMEDEVGEYESVSSTTVRQLVTEWLAANKRASLFMSPSKP